MTTARLTNRTRGVLKKTNLHDGLEAAVALAGLPSGDEVEEVDALGGLALVLALGARELDGGAHEHGEARGGVAHAHEASVEVDLGGECGDAEECGVADDHKRGDGLVEEALFDVGGLLEDEYVAAGALGRSDLR